MPQPSVNVGNFISAVQRRLDGSAVGYSGCIGSVGDPDSPHMFQGGQARTVAGAEPVNDTGVVEDIGAPLAASTSIPFGIASVSKLFTALAAVRLLDGRTLGEIDGTPIPAPLTLDSPIHLALPTDWVIHDPNVEQITFRELLTHTSGLPAEGSPGEPAQDYVSIEQFLTQQKVLPAPPTEPPYGTPTPRYPDSYSNFGFALFRILLPTVNSMQSPTPTWEDDPGLPVDERAQNFASEYERVVLQNVFDPVRVSGPQTGTPANDYAFGYTYPDTGPGDDWSDGGLSLVAGAGGWFMSIDEMEPALRSLNSVDGRILTSDQWLHMQGQYKQDNPNHVPAGFDSLGLGIDTLVDPSTGDRWVEKNGGGPGPNGTFSASVAFFGAAPSFAALLTNSNVGYPWPAQAAWYLCTKCDALFYDGPDYHESPGGVCPGNHNGSHVTWGQYSLATGEMPGVPIKEQQLGWKQCIACQALCFDLVPKPLGTHAGRGYSPGVCPANGGGPHICPFGDYVLNLTGDSSLELQNNWKWCCKCGVLAFGDYDGVCADGHGPHDYSKSGNYSVVMYPIGADSVLKEAFLDAIGP